MIFKRRIDVHAGAAGQPAGQPTRNAGKLAVLGLGHCWLADKREFCSLLFWRSELRQSPSNSPQLVGIMGLFQAPQSVTSPPAAVVRVFNSEKQPGD